MILLFQNLLGLCEGRVPGCLLGYSGSVSPCNTKGGPLNFNTYVQKGGTADGGTVVKVLRYKSEGRWFDSRWYHWNFSLT
jgi:hypothetical protein